MFRAIPDEIKAFSSSTEAISAWEVYTGESYDDFLADKDLIEETDAADTNIFEVDIVDWDERKYSGQIEVFIGFDGGIISEIKAFIDGDKATKEWEQYTGTSFADFTKEGEIVGGKQSHMGTTIYVLTVI